MIDKTKVLFFTGAGISVDSGIPTFQEQPGIRDKLTRSFANEHPEEYRNAIRGMVNSCENAMPNEAHKAIAKYGYQVITMNVDALHRKAGSTDVLEIHGVLPDRATLEEPDFPLTYNGIVLYDDLAPKYADAIKLVKNLKYDNSYFVIVGTSFYTGISEQLYHLAKQRKAKIVVINENASERVPVICKNLSDLTI